MTDEEGFVTKIEYLSRSEVRVNAGFFVLRKEIFDYIRPGEELVEEPFQRLIPMGSMVAVRSCRSAVSWSPTVAVMRSKLQRITAFMWRRTLPTFREMVASTPVTRR